MALNMVTDLTGVESLKVRRTSSPGNAGRFRSLTHSAVKPLRNGVPALAETGNEVLTAATTQNHRHHRANLVHAELFQLIEQSIEGFLRLIMSG